MEELTIVSCAHRKGILDMVLLLIWTINGECRSIPMDIDSEEYEKNIQVLESDPFVKCYVVQSL